MYFWFNHSIFLWIFKQGTGNYILDFCFCKIRKLISFRKHKITCIFKSGKGGLLPSTIKTQRSRSFKTQEVVVYKYFVGGCVLEQSRSVGLFCSIIVVVNMYLNSIFLNG